MARTARSRRRGRARYSRTRAGSRRSGRHDQVAAERQRAADARRGAVDRRDHRLFQLADRVHDPVVALGQALADVGASPRASIASACVLQVRARGEGAPGACDHAPRAPRRPRPPGAAPRAGPGRAACSRRSAPRPVQLDRGDTVGETQVDRLELGRWTRSRLPSDPVFLCDGSAPVIGMCTSLEQSALERLGPAGDAVARLRRAVQRAGGWR